MLRHSVLGLALLVVLSACSGGGSTGSALPAAPQIPTHAAALQSITLSIDIPAANSGAAAHRRPLYVSTATQSAAIAVNSGTRVVVNLAPGSASCVAAAGGAGRVCNATIIAPVGVDTFSETLFASTNGTGSALSQSTTTATIVAGTANVISLTLDGVVASIALSLANAAPPVGTAATIALTVNANDAAGATIIGSDPFTNPITLTDSDKSGTVTTLTKTTLASPADTVSVTYNGGALSSATFTASAAGAVPGSVTLTPKAGAIGFNDYTTFGYDNGRDVFNPNSTAITPSNLPHLAWQSTIGDFNTQSQPILATEIPGHAGVLFVGGGSGNAYGYDALTGARLWKQNLAPEMTYTCDNSSQQFFGVGGSAAYDPASKSLYIVDNTNPSQNAYAQNVLYRLDAATGKILGSFNFAPAPIGAVSELNFTHVSVALNNGIAYVGTGSTCDLSSWRGAVVAVNVPSMTFASRFFTVWDPLNSRGQGAQPWSGGGVWGWGGVSLDPSGNVLTGVGNTDQGLSNGTLAPPYGAPPHEFSGYAETLLELSAGLSSVITNNHPIPISTYSALANDLDVQGTPLVFNPNGTGCGTMVALQGKSGELNLYNESRISAGPAAQFQLASTSSDDAYLGSPAYSPASGLVYAPVATTAVPPLLLPPGLIAIDPGCGNPSVTWHTAFGTDSTASGIPRSVPAVSAGGVVFAGTVSGSGGDIWALDASTGTLLHGGTPILHTNGNLRVPPTIDGNWVFILDNDGDLYGLTIDPNFKAIQAQYRAVSPRPQFRRKRRA